MNNIKRRILSRGLMFFASLGTLTSCAVSDIVAKRGMSEKEMQLISNTPKITVTTEQLEVVSDIGQDYFVAPVARIEPSSKPQISQIKGTRVITRETTATHTETARTSEPTKESLRKNILTDLGSSGMHIRHGAVGNTLHPSDVSNRTVAGKTVEKDEAQIKEDARQKKEEEIRQAREKEERKRREEEERKEKERKEKEKRRKEEEEISRTAERNALNMWSISSGMGYMF